MGTASKTESQPREQGQQIREGTSRSIGSPISNEAYDVITGRAAFHVPGPVRRQPR